MKSTRVLLLLIKHLISKRYLHRRVALEKQLRHLIASGMVLWQNTFFLRKEPAEELVAAMQHVQGTHLWLPLPAARAMPKWPLRERLEEVMVEGAKGVRKLGEREGSTGSRGLDLEPYAKKKNIHTSHRYIHKYVCILHIYILTHTHIYT